MHNKAGYLKSEATLCCQIVTKLIQKQVPLGCVEEQATDTHDKISITVCHGMKSGWKELTPTMGFESAMRSRRESRKPWSSTIWALMSWSLATQTAAVFLTYGSSSFRHFLSGSHRYSVILSTRMQPMVRTARARIRGLGSSQSWRPTRLN